MYHVLQAKNRTKRMMKKQDYEKIAETNIINWYFGKEFFIQERRHLKNRSSSLVINHKTKRILLI